jgi:DNA topoisomerase IB
MIKKIENGILRVSTNLKVYESKDNNWVLSKKTLPETLSVVNLFKSNNRLKEIIDTKNKKFLKGQLSKQGQVQGARIKILPTGEKLDKTFSIFAKNLTFHDESSHDHWDVIYQNPNGKFAYCYTLEKKSKAQKSKYRKVSDFEKIYKKLEKKARYALKDKEDIYAVPMYTLLKTYMRVGNELNYNQTGHKGLTTLKKEDISILNNKVTFNYISKSGVPMEISREFPNDYIKRLKDNIKNKKNSDFVFEKNNKPMKDTDFMNTFEDYCGQRFYPHIVRSYYATKKAKEFLQKHNKAEKRQIKSLFLEIAEQLGHKRFDKKNNEWKDSYTITIHHYIQPDLVEKIEKLSGN